MIAPLEPQHLEDELTVLCEKFEAMYDKAHPNDDDDTSDYLDERKKYIEGHGSKELVDAYNERRRIIAEAKEHGIILG